MTNGKHRGMVYIFTASDDKAFLILKQQVGSIAKQAWIGAMFILRHPFLAPLRMALFSKMQLFLQTSMSLMFLEVTKTMWIAIIVGPFKREALVWTYELVPVELHKSIGIKE